jgi:predicted aspartyl protease
VNQDIDRRRLLALAGASAAFAPSLAQAKAYPLQVKNDRIWLDAMVNGVKVEALLDSGAEISTADPVFVRRLGLSGGQDATARGSGAAAMSAKLIQGVRIEAAGVVVPDAMLGVVDLSDVGRRLLGRPLDLIVGRDLFYAARLMIDLKGGRIEAVSKSRRPRGVELPLIENKGNEELPLVVEGRAPVSAVFDLGNGGSVNLSREYAEKIGLFDGRPVGERTAGGLGGAVVNKTLTLKSVTLAGRTFNDVPATIDAKSDGVDANVGVGLLKRFGVVADFADRKVWLDPR